MSKNDVRNLGVGKRRSVPGCQFWVYENNEAGGGACGDPVVAEWSWGEDKLLVCREHDHYIDHHNEQKIDDKAIHPFAARQCQT